MRSVSLGQFEDSTHRQSSADDATALIRATARVPRVGPDETTAGIIHQLSTTVPFESMTDIAVVQGGKLVGIIGVEDLFAAPDDTTASEIMDPDPPSVGPTTDQEAAALAAAEHEGSVAVIDSGGMFVGLIPPERMLGVLVEEHREDMARISGYLHQSEAARTASRESLARRFWHRFPWLLVGLAAAMAAAAIVAGFERGLAAHLELVFFIPGIVYIADAVGTQTETLVVRGLSIGVSVRSIMLRELATGLLLGLSLGALAYPLIVLWFGTGVAATFAVSVLAASTVATGVAMGLPWLIDRAGLDPAFGSGPLSTVIQDLLSLAIYFTFATAFVA